MSSVYQRLLLVVDLGADSLFVGQRAKAIAEVHEAEVELLHVLELPARLKFADIDPLVEAGMHAPQAREKLLADTRRRMGSLATELGLPSESCHIEEGNRKAEIARIAREHQIDLIVIGSHERHGASAFLSSTGDAVAHTASCDVLAVRLPV